MLNNDQKNYLKKIPADKIISISPFNTDTTLVTHEIIQAINRLLPDIEVKHMGASSLGISGQNDIDIYALSESTDFNKYLPSLIKLFGLPEHKHLSSVEWKFKKNGFDIELYLTDPHTDTMQQQLAVYNALKNNLPLLKKYETMKISMNGKSFRDYQKKKYEFFNKILKTFREDEHIRVDGERFAGIVINKTKLLLMHRIKNGYEYYVFPGGHRRKGEKPNDCVIREIKEETSIDVKHPNLVFEMRDHKNKHTNCYYTFDSCTTGTPKLNGEEKIRNCKANFYDPQWIDLSKTKYLNILPKFAKEWLLENIEEL